MGSPTVSQVATLTSQGPSLSRSPFPTFDVMMPKEDVLRMMQVIPVIYQCKRIYGMRTSLSVINPSAPLWAKAASNRNTPCGRLRAKLLQVTAFTYCVSALEGTARACDLFIFITVVHYGMKIYNKTLPSGITVSNFAARMLTQLASKALPSLLLHQRTLLFQAQLLCFTMWKK